MVQLPIDFNLIRAAFAQRIQAVTGLDQDHVILAEPETQDVPRPSKPYFSFKLTTPAAKMGDDSKDNVPDESGDPTTVWNSGGVRKMSVGFDCYGRSHEEAYNLMSLWQTALDLEDVQQELRRSGIAVWIIGNVADLSQLLNTGFEGRAHIDCFFGIAMNLQSDLGSMEIITVDGSINTGQGTVNTSQTENLGG